MLSDDTFRQIEEILLNPVNAATIHDAKPHTMSPQARSGTLKASDRLMIPSGEVRHRSSCTFLDKRADGDPDQPGPEKYRFEFEHTGYWSRLSTITLLLPIEFRGMTPVWMFALSGNLQKSSDTEKDHAMMDRVEEHITRAHRRIFQLRRDGDKSLYFRAPEFEHEKLSYKSQWSGSFKDFHGEEKVTLDYTSIVWKAHFFGRVIDPIS